MTDHVTTAGEHPHIPSSVLRTAVPRLDARLKVVLLAAAVGLIAVLSPVAARSTASAGVTNLATATWSIHD